MNQSNYPNYGVQNVIIPAPPQPASRSRIEYVPVEQKIVDYQTRQWIQSVPRQKTITQYQERRWTQQVPREVTRMDHYAVEYLTEYIPQVYTTTEIQMVPQEVTVQHVNYVPVQRQINHGVQASGQVMNTGYQQQFNTMSSSQLNYGTGFSQNVNMMNSNGYPSYQAGYPGAAIGAALTTSTINYNNNLSTSGVRYGPPITPQYNYPQVQIPQPPNGFPTGNMMQGMNMSVNQSMNGGYMNMGNMNGMNMNAMNTSQVNYGLRGSRYKIETPGVVTNVLADGTVMETPVVVTNMC